MRKIFFSIVKRENDFHLNDSLEHIIIQTKITPKTVLVPNRKQKLI